MPPVITAVITNIAVDALGDTVNKNVIAKWQAHRRQRIGNRRQGRIRFDNIEGLQAGNGGRVEANQEFGDMDGISMDDLR